jgi:hypothetical protein
LYLRSRALSQFPQRARKVFLSLDVIELELDFKGRCEEWKEMRMKVGKLRNTHGASHGIQTIKEGYSLTLKIMWAGSEHVDGCIPSGSYPLMQPPY